MKDKSGSGIVLFWLVSLLGLLGSYGAYAQANVETFGQNRVQYRKFDWKFFETEHFNIYHYDAAGRQLARYVAEQVEKDIQVVESKLGGQFPNRFKIIVYNSYDDYRQTNIGRKYDAQIQNTHAGTVDLVGDKLVVYFTGVHTDLRHQTRLGMATVVMQRMLFGESFREMVKNAVLMNMPEWTVEGYIAYMVDGWDANTNTEWKNMVLAHPNAGFNELSQKNPELAGKAFWKFISDKYGDDNMKNLLYAMQVKSSVNQGVKVNLGMNIKKAYDSTLLYYKEVYAMDTVGRDVPDSNTALIEIRIPKDGSVIRTIKVAPKGNDVGYVAWKDGEYKVYLQKTKNEQERSTLLEGGRKDYNEQPDPNYPLLAWSNNGYKMAILYKKGTQTRLRIYNSLKAKIENYVIPPNRFDRVTGITFMEDDANLVFSTLKKSQADLYEFRIKGSKLTNITNDPWDDTDPWFVSGGSRKGILFLSNRPAPNLEVPVGVNELPTGPMNVFFYNTTTKRKELVQMSHVKNGVVSQPIQYGSDNYAYLYDENGIRNKYVVLMGRDVNNMDSAYAVPITNYPHNMIAHQYNPASNQVADVLQDGDKYKVYFKPLEIPGVNVAPKEATPSILSVTEINKKSITPDEPLYISPVIMPKKFDTKKHEPILKKGNVFQSEFDEEPVVNDPPATVPTPDTMSVPALAQLDTTKDAKTVLTDTVAAKPAAVLPDSTFVKMKGEPYRLNFKPDFFTVRLDNSVLFTKYQPVAQNLGQYSNPPLGGMISVALDDLMENHRFTGGLRLPINFSGTTYFMQYENFTRRTDWGILYLRSTDLNTIPVGLVDSSGTLVDISEQTGKNTTNMIQGNISYPLDRVRSVKVYMGFRIDDLIIKLQDPVGLAVEGEALGKQYWNMNRVEYVFDNTINPVLNIYRGMRYKFYAEYLYKLNGSNGGFVNLGLDFRNYQKIHKNFIWATRFAAAHSLGNQKILYYMGGVDNWIQPKYSSYVPVRPTENYAFQAIATNLRGYPQNSRNGNTYAVVNTELRLPVLATFLRRPIQSGFLKNLQVVTFVDAGSAWSGLLPNADALRNDRYLAGGSDPEVSLMISDQTGGLGLGYGAGLRTSLAGYFIRADVAWNIEGSRKPLLHISLGTDF
jgi:hypothetical protein